MAGSERKRKRSHRDQAHRRQLNSSEVVAGKSSGAREEIEAEDGTSKSSQTPTRPRPPLDDEVEEFFGILRRMHAAVKYFGKSGHGNGTMRWTASETGLPLTAPAINCGAGQVKGVEQKAENCVSFDLNVVPAEAAEDNGD